VVLISGDARRMGAAHAETLVSQGARVSMGDVLDDDGRRSPKIQVHQLILCTLMSRTRISGAPPSARR
jgi:NAD(P)-dependent dehydrogenase (short-subunit alcohol dehydrogenase family)